MISISPVLLKLRQLAESSVPSFKFWKECRKIWDTVNDGGSKLRDMVASSVGVAPEVFASVVDLNSYPGLSGYQDGIDGLDEFLSDDPSSGLFKSTFDSKPCYYVKHHGFETVFLQAQHH